jgi:drug/metabolite transporter (DMT)-like permease
MIFRIYSDGIRKGILFAILSSFFFALRSTIIKSAPIERVETLLVLRFFFDLLILTPFFFKYRDALKTKRLSLYLGRSIAVALSIYCSIYGIKHLALGDAIILQYTLPLFIPLMYWFFYRKRISAKSVYLLFIGFISLFFLLKPNFDMLHLASFASLSVGVLGAFMAVTLHELSKTEHIVAILFYSTLIAGGVSIIPCIHSWEPIPFSTVMIYIVPISILGLIHQYLITRAYAMASPHIVGGFVYFCVLFSVLFGWLFWGETLDTMKIVSGIFLMLCGVMLVRENNLKTGSATEPQN